MGNEVFRDFVLDRWKESMIKVEFKMRLQQLACTHTQALHHVSKGNCSFYCKVFIQQVSC